MLSVDEAQERILARVHPLSGEPVPLAAVAGRTLSAPITSDRDLPGWDNSAMDGFAVRVEDLPGALPVQGTVGAGMAPGQPLQAGQTMRIMTGAPLPSGANAVVMREEVEDRGDSATFAAAPTPGAHIRRRGEDIARGEAALDRGTPVGAGEIGLLAALGMETVAVTRRPRVGILATGDELVPLGEAPLPGQHINSSSSALAEQCREAGEVPTLLGIS